jgi:hypothetical protein
MSHSRFFAMFVNVVGNDSHFLWMSWKVSKLGVLYWWVLGLLQFSHAVEFWLQSYNINWHFTWVSARVSRTAHIYLSETCFLKKAVDKNERYVQYISVLQIMKVGLLHFTAVVGGLLNTRLPNISTAPQGVVSQKVILFIVSAVRTSNQQWFPELTRRLAECLILDNN